MSEQEPWALREWKLLEQCSGIYCWSHPVQSPTDRNPDATLFTSATTPLAQAFQQDFTDNVAALVVDPRGYTVPEQYEAAISIIDSGNDYRSSFSNNRSFRNLIQQELDSIQSSLTPDDIVARATSQSCAGCHNLTVGDNLGGGLVGEPSLGFTHVGENGSLSLGLLEQLLPEREDIVRAFMP